MAICLVKSCLLSELYCNRLNQPWAQYLPSLRPEFILAQPRGQCWWPARRLALVFAFSPIRI